MDPHQHRVGIPNVVRELERVEEEEELMLGGVVQMQCLCFFLELDEAEEKPNLEVDLGFFGTRRSGRET